MAAIRRAVVPDAEPSERTPRQVRDAFRRALAAGMRLRVAGEAREDPESLLDLGYTPRFHLVLFDTEFYLANLRQNEDIRFFVAYVVQRRAGAAQPDAHARIFYKDVSLVWRSASHFIRSEGENWIGKGDVEHVVVDGRPGLSSAEETTDLPFELQAALETLCRRTRRVLYDDDAVAWILRRAPDTRIWAYRDFLAPRERARADPRNRIHGGRAIARFRRKGDPASLTIAKGYEPDFREGALGASTLSSRLYGGQVARHRFVSRNRQIQYLFFAAPRHVWLGHPQATTTELMSYGVRTVDVVADEDLSIPGYEYHFLDDAEDPPALHSQIPEGFAGEASAVDPSRADASAWLEALPVVRAFREQVLA